MAKTKMELDKEHMFDKIMPSASRTKKKSKAPVSRELDDEFDEQIDDDATDDGALSGSALTSALTSAQSYSESLKSSIEQIMKPLERTPPVVSAVKIAETDSSYILNLTEQVVSERLEATFEKFSGCKCDRCKKDVMALALNKLKPHYLVVEKNAAAPVAEQKLTAEVTTALIQAVIQVKANPRHQV